MAEPRERHILFSGPMVRAILDRRKTQTRRIISPAVPDWQWVVAYGDGTYGRVGPDFESNPFPCPYGQPGDRLWVRETWVELDREHWGDQSLPREAIYSHPWPRVNACAYRADTTADGEEARRSYGYRWRPSIHMPRWASRLTLEVMGVRVERLQDITQADARAEGVVDTSGAWSTVSGALSDTSRAGPRGAFEALWNDINGAESWDANPWVWVVEFRRVEVPHG